MIINTKDIQKACNMEITSPLTYIDNGAKILAVAHMDCAIESNKFKVNGGRVYCPRLDNRIGLYIITKLLPSLNINTDVLLTTDEEIGESTAYDFKTSKKYKWIVAFDRTGQDVVLYDYYSAKIVEALESCDFEIGIGSYSDICELEHLGAKAFNIGIGMYEYHSKKSFVKLDEMMHSIEKFVLFYEKYSEVEFEHVPSIDNDYDFFWPANYRNTENERYWDEIDKNCHDIWYNDNEK